MPTLPTHDPLSLTVATREQINARRDELEAAPVSVQGYLVDVDERSDLRLREILDTWDAQGLTSIDWVMADNTEVTLDKAGLQSLYDDARVARASRAMQLHKKATAFKNDPSTTLRDIEPENW